MKKELVKKSRIFMFSIVVLFTFGIPFNISSESPLFQLGSNLFQVSTMAQSIGDIDLPEIPDSNTLKCRCKNDDDGNKICGSGNHISLRPKCAEFESGQGICGLYSINC
ncbi:hypothetical protein E4S40_15670 [Algoriphagus kandeliae]|uniref:Uncharacterized protein n=1 Tax=Algoriphagus kandeliae TaxID=2562278 RepID=A0A4Y9QN47_9BACT|nr:hypothetical protein [Algoriphagus kandeliae]TFV93680.1 hypothetical protein E4S40_15670 [Algoriphagus kandeliae]